jgi:hypothetical protein
MTGMAGSLTFGLAGAFDLALGDGLALGLGEAPVTDVLFLDLFTRLTTGASLVSG